MVHRSRVLEDALSLPEIDRAEVAARLIDSLDQAHDEDFEQAWDAEIARRIEELDIGLRTPIPWPEARRIISGNLGRRDE
jgi:putative addiction module component (TIGR02574 family)